MNIKPASIPPLPKGFVYLGVGGSFKIPAGKNSRPLFHGLGFSRGLNHTIWVPSEDGYCGVCTDYHYAAPADSEIAKLNGLSASQEAIDLRTCKIGQYLRRRDGKIVVYLGRTHSAAHQTGEANLATLLGSHLDVHFCSGNVWPGKEDPRDIVEIYPLIDLSSCPIGTSVKRRDGKIGVLESYDRGIEVADIRTAEARNAVLKTGRANYYDGPDRDYDIVEILPTPTIQSSPAQEPSELEALKARIAVLEKEAADLKAKQGVKTCAVPTPAWNPAKHRDAFLFSNLSGRPESVPSHRRHDRVRNVGAYFTTPAAAKSAGEYRIFYTRLLNLAAELNPSGLVGGNFLVWRNVQHNCWMSDIITGTGRISRGLNCLFETHEAAEKAAEILTRDGWKVPALPSK